ncbi:UNVERIFIED_CONTAM: hypothetical protein Slati_1472900 [Sesamum latifolium]|uniref:DUF4283 domain-containing protein n=1 Tax=Sesamum latifolium TaxID=2727402 RepID=A0AAW2X6R1_9LAMI
MEEVINGGPWLFQGQPIVLQRWESGMALRRHKLTQVPIWIKLRHLPIEFWTEEGLSMMASGIGRPLYLDAITKACTRLNFARVCVMLDVSSTLPKHIVILAPTKDGGEVPCRVDVEYEWIPPKCKECRFLGHRMADCTNKPKSTKPLIAVYVKRRKDENVVNTDETSVPKSTNAPMPVVTKHTSPTEMKPSNGNITEVDKGKAIIVYNPFDALLLHDDDTGNFYGGPKECSPAMGVP